MIHVMLDIETWASEANNPVITAIGAVKFNADAVIERFEVGVDPADCQRYGLVIEADTVDWWLHEGRADARRVLAKLGRVDLFAALDGFATWVRETPADTLGSVWGNGAVFDNVKVQSAFRAAGLEWPFNFRQDGCYRTLKNLAPDVEFVREGVHHNPVDDALSQARHLQKICRHLGVAL